MALRVNELTGEISVVTTRWKWWLASFAILGLIATGVLLNSPDDPTYWRSVSKICIVGLFLPYTLWRAVGRSQTIEITSKGFSVGTAKKSHWFEWGEVSSFALIDVKAASQKGKAVVFQRRDGRVEQLTMSANFYSKLNAIVLPNPGLMPKKLVVVMNEARDAGLRRRVRPQAREPMPQSRRNVA